MRAESIRSDLYLDIETIPDHRAGALEEIAASIQPPGNISKPETIARWHAEDKPRAIEEAWCKTALSGARGHIAVIGYALNDDEPIALWSPLSPANDEPEILGYFFSELDRLSKGGRFAPRLVGHNVAAFDLRFLFQRAIVLGIRPPHWWPIDAKPWESDRVFDTMTAWAGVRGLVSMADMCDAFGIAGKGDINGSKVWEYVRDGRIAEVADYCRGDVERTRAIARRMEFRDLAQHGVLTEEQFLKERAK